MSTKTVTIDTNEWLYPDVSGITHAVTNGQTFTFELTDGGASAVTYQTDNIFDVGTEVERFAKAVKYIRVTCQQKLYSTMVMYPDGGHLKNRFEIFLYNYF